MKKGALILLAIVCFFACSDSEYESSEQVAELAISFTDPVWDGADVPEKGQCTNCGGEGFSPPLLVKNIPEDTDVLIVEFHDKSVNVFHGAFRIKVPKKTELVIPSVKETAAVPKRVELKIENNAVIGGKAAYWAPCGCGSRNEYVAEIVALKNQSSDQKLLIGKGEIKLGKF